MKKRNTATFALVVLVLFISAFCLAAQSAHAGEKPDDIVIATSSPTNTFYYIGAGQAKILDEAIKGIVFSVEASTGSKENLVFTNQRADTMGIVPLDYCYAGYTGDKTMDFPDALTNVRLVRIIRSCSSPQPRPATRRYSLQHNEDAQ